jgi:alanine dehydrogenase
VVTGASGGVGSIAIDILTRAGYEAHAISGKVEQFEWLRSLGAKQCISRKELYWSEKPMDSAHWAGAIDNVGGEMLSGLTRVIKPWGSIASCGMAGGIGVKTTVMPFIIRGIGLLGINSSGCPYAIRKELWMRLADAWKPAHLDRIDAEVRRHLLFERGYGQQFGIADDEIASQVGGVVAREELLRRADVVLLPKPLAADLAEMRDGQVLWGWLHLVQDPEVTQLAIDRRLSVIAWEAMNHWNPDGSYSLHVFHLNNEIAGYAAVIHSLQLRGASGHYGRRLRAAVISFGATARGAVRALDAMGVHDVDVLTQRDSPAVAAPFGNPVMGQFERLEDDPRHTRVLRQDGPQATQDFLAEHDIIVNCVLQDTDAPLVFVQDSHALAPGTLVVDVSVDEGMGFSWSRPTSFADPMIEVGDRVHYYAVDHTPSLYWESATWTISEALLPYLDPVQRGPAAWAEDTTISRALEVDRGEILNEQILGFQGRSATYPHPVRTVSHL